MSSLKLSIIIAAYNSEKYLSECLKSVLDQNYSNYEVIVVDDGSQDSTPMILSTFKENDSRVRIVTQSNQGRSEARNTGISLAKGKYIWVIDHDDRITKNCILPIINVMELLDTEVFAVAPPKEFKQTLPPDYQVDILGGVTNITTGKDFLLEDASYWAPWQFIIKKEFYDSYGFRFRLRYFLEDIELMYRVFYHTKRFAALKNFSCYAYIQRPESETKNPWTRNKILDFSRYVNLVEDFVQQEISEKKLKNVFELKRTQFYMNGINNWKTISKEMMLSEYLDNINSIPHITYGNIIERAYQLLSIFAPGLFAKLL